MIIAVAVIGSKKQSFLWRDQPQKRSKRTTTTTTRRRKRHFENKRTKKKRQKCDVVMFFFVCSKSYNLTFSYECQSLSRGYWLSLPLSCSTYLTHSLAHPKERNVESAGRAPTHFSLSLPCETFVLVGGGFKTREVTLNIRRLCRSVKSSFDWKCSMRDFKLKLKLWSTAPRFSLTAYPLLRGTAMMVKGAKALEVWCRRVTEGYPVSWI